MNTACSAHAVSARILQALHASALNLLGLIAVVTLASAVYPVAARAEVYELRTYTAREGKLDALHQRFRDHTVGLFAKHGMKSVGYWVPTEPPRSEDTLIYILEHDSREAASESWKAFLADPEWQEVYRKSQADGPILAKAPESVYMQKTDYSPEYQVADGDQPGLYELRLYRTNEGKLDDLDARFRDHTIGLFDRHGLQSIAYWHPTGDSAADDTLIYLLRYDDREAARAAWKAFGSDPEWKKVAEESQRDGRFLRERPESIYMKPTDYSQLQ